MVDSLDEQTLVEQAKRDPEAFGRLYDRYYQAIFGYVLRRTSSVEAAEDIVAETFCKAMKKLWQFQWRNVPFSAWLYRIASNEIMNYYRNQSGYHAMALEDLPELADPSDVREEMMAAEDEVQRKQEYLALQQHLKALPLKYQEVLTLRYFENKKLDEIAIILDKKLGTVKSLLHRGQDYLRKELNQ